MAAWRYCIRFSSSYPSPSPPASARRSSPYRDTSSYTRRSQRGLAARSQKSHVRADDVESFPAITKLTTTSRRNRRFASGDSNIAPSSPPSSSMDAANRDRRCCSCLWSPSPWRRSSDATIAMTYSSMTLMASRIRRSLPTLASFIAFQTNVVGWNTRATEISTASSNAAKNAACRGSPPSSSVELSTPNATLQMLSKPKRLNTSCKSTASPEPAAAAAASKGTSRRWRCARRTRAEKRRSDREEK
uniref:Uncharacterized protein n=1 Tax=Oryza brachyantha TaxID=4533 RepID=J3L7W3_ORYBR